MNPLANPPYLLPPIIAGLSSCLLCLVVARQARQRFTHLLFALFLLEIGTWSFLVYFMRASPDVQHALLWENRFLPVMFSSSPTFYAFTRVYTHLKQPRIVAFFGLVYVAAIAVMSSQGMLVQHMDLRSYGYAPIFAPLFYVLALTAYVWIGLGMVNLFRAYRVSQVYEERNRLLYMVVGTLFPIAGTLIDILPSSYPLSILGNLAFGAITTVAIVRYQLLDISLVIRKGLAYLVISVFVAVPYVTTILFASKTLNGTTFQPFVYPLVLIVLAIVLQPLWSRVQVAVDKVFFRQRWDSFRALEQFTQRSRSIAELEQPAQELVETIRTAMQAEGVSLLMPLNGEQFEPVATSGKPVAATHGLAKDSPVTLWLDREQQPLELKRLDLEPQLQYLSGADRQLFEASGATFLVPLRMRERLSGILVLGPKLAETPYSKEELTLLSAVATQTAVLLDDARLYQSMRDQLELSRRRLEALEDATSRLALEEDPDRALQKLVAVARELLITDRIMLAVTSPLHQVSQVFTSGVSGEEEQRLRRFLDLHLSSRMDYGSTELWAFVLGNEALVAPETLRASFVTKNRGTGVFELAGRTQGQPFLADDERLLNLFTVLAGVLLDNVDLYEDVAQERRTLAAIQESMAEGLIVLAPDRHILYCNKAAELLLNVQAHRSLGHRIEETLRFKAADFEISEQLETLLAFIASPPEKPRNLDIGIVNPQRQDLSITFFSIPTEQALMMTGILVRDITQERDLARRRDDFVSIASHELRTPMTTIMGFSELLLARDPGPDARREWLQYIHRDIQRLALIVEDLLNISRIQSGRIKVEVEPLDLAEIVAGLSIVKASTQRHPIQLFIPKNLPLVAADQQKLTQILNNLVDNAIKYSPDGGTVTIRGCYEADNDRVVVSVQDQGIGIADEDRQRLFTMFHRISRPETQGIRGTGLGLYIVKEMVELMHGEIWLESKLNQGTRFSFSLPCQPVINDPGDVASLKLARRAS